MRRAFLLLSIPFIVFAQDIELSEELYKNGLFQTSLDLLRDASGPYPAYLRAECLFELKDYRKAYQQFLLAKSRIQKRELLPKICFRIADCLWLLGEKREAVSEYEVVIERYPDHPTLPAALFRIGRFYTERGDYGSATEAFLQIVSSHSDIAEIDHMHYLLGSLFDRMGEREKAYNHFRYVVERSDRSDLRLASYSWIIRYLYKKREYTKALLIAGKVLAEEHPDAEVADEARRIIFCSLYKRKNYEEAVLVFDKIKAVNREMQIAYADSLYQLGRYEEAIEAYKKVGTSSSVYYNIGFCYLELGSYTDAIRSFENAEIDDSLLYLIADIARRMEDREKEIEAYKEILEYPETEFREEVLSLLGLSYFDIGSITEAVAVCERMCREYPGSPYLLRLLHKLSIHFGEREEALFFLRKIAEQYPHFEPDKILYRIGRINYRLFRYKEAEDTFSLLREKHPNSELIPSALFHLASIARIGGKEDRAYRIYKVIPLFSEEMAAKALFYAANVVFSEKEYKRALRDYKAVVDQFPNSDLADEVYYQIGWCYYKMERFKDAHRAFEKVAKAGSPYSASAIYWCGWSHFMQGEYEEAEKDYLQVIERAHSGLREEARFRLASSLYNQGRFAEAQKVYQEVVEEMEDPKLKREALYQVGDCLLKQRKMGGAISYYKLFLEASSDIELKEQVQFRIAEIYYQEGKKDLARAEYERFISDFPDSERLPDAYYWIGRSFLPEEPEKALSYFKRVAETESDWAAESRFRTGVILHNIGRYRESAKEFEKVVKYHRDREDLVAEAKEYLERMGYGETD